MSNNPLNSYQIDSFAHQPHIIPAATPKNAGAMSATQAAQLAALAGGSLGAVLAWSTTTPWSQIAAQIPAAVAKTGGAVILLTDLFATYEVTPGDYNFDNVVFFGLGGQLLDLQAGVHIIGNDFNFMFTGCSTNGFVSDTVANFNIFYGSLAATSGATPFLCTATVGFNEVNLVTANLGAGTSTPVFSIDGAGGFLLISVQAASSLGAGANANSVIAATPGGSDFLDLFYDDSSYNQMPAAVSFIAPSVTNPQFARDGQRGLIKTGAGAVTVSQKEAFARAYVQITSSANITSLGVDLPNPTSFSEGQRLTLILVQGNAAHTWPNTIAHVQLPGGTFAKTTTLGGKDRLDLILVNGVWLATVTANLS